MDLNNIRKDNFNINLDDGENDIFNESEKKNILNNFYNNKNIFNNPIQGFPYQQDKELNNFLFHLNYIQNQNHVFRTNLLTNMMNSKSYPNQGSSQIGNYNLNINNPDNFIQGKNFLNKPPNKK